MGCPNLCSFCNQRTIAGQNMAPPPESVSETVQNSLTHAGGVAEVAFYGGSFTCIDRDLQAAYLNAVAPFLEKGQVNGIRISTRPDAVGEDVLDFLSEKGVRTIELGVQSMVDEVLQANHRGHLSRHTREGAERIKAHGFRLGLQMMTGLLGDTPAGAVKTAEEFAALDPSFVRIYPTVVLPGTDLANA
ncbi:MAG: radical SAM protein, partial [Clostridia bacterium]|nr:radical SAM protein [Clostridia bacterium]